MNSIFIIFSFGKASVPSQSADMDQENPDPHYVITPDNAKKMLAIHERLRYHFGDFLTQLFNILSRGSLYIYFCLC